jgi:hypothetical protein
MNSPMDAGRCRVSVATLMLAIGLWPGAANAIIVTEDNLSGYANGPLVGHGGWQAHSGAGTKAVQVNTGTIRLEQSTGSGEDVNKRWFVPRAANATTYARFHLKVEPGSVIGTTPDFFAHFRPGALDTNNFVTRVYIGPPADGSHFTLGVTSAAIGVDIIVVWPVALTMGQTYQIVTSYDGVTGASQLWVDPTSEAGTSITTGPSATVSGRQIESYAFRQVSPAGTTSFQTINDMAVGTTFADVTGSAGVPLLSAWNLIVMAFGLGLAGMAYTQSRHSRSFAASR